MTKESPAIGRKKPRRYATEQYKGFTIRFIDPAKTKHRRGVEVKPRLPFWQTDNNDAKNRKRASFPTLEAAKQDIREKAVELENRGRGAYDMTDAQRVAAADAFKKLGKKTTLDEVLAFWKKHNEPAEGKTLKEMFDGWMQEAEDDGLAPTSIRQNKQRGGVFVAAIGPKTVCAGVTPEMVKAFIKGRECGKATKRSWQKTLNAFFEYCLEQKAIESNPIHKKRRGRRKPKDEIIKQPHFMPVKMVETIMQKAEELHPEIVPALAVMFFAGLRPFEVSAQYRLKSDDRATARNAVAVARLEYKKLKKRKHGSAEELNEAQRMLNRAISAAQKVYEADPATMGGLQWENVNLAERFIRVLPETSKTRAGRLVEIGDNLLAWLAKYYKASGPVAPSPVTFIRYRREVMKEAKLRKWLPDVARHSYATYHFAMYESQDKLQAQMGHSGKAYILTKHYRGLATKTEAEKFWGILPKGAEGEGQNRQTFQLASATKGA